MWLIYNIYLFLKQLAVVKTMSFAIKAPWQVWCPFRYIDTWNGASVMSISPLPLISGFFDTSIRKKNVEKMEKHNHDHCKAASDD